NAEDGALMDVEKFFGPKLAKRMQPPARDSEGDPVYSRLAEEFYFHLDTRLTETEEGKAPPFILLLDSMDALTSRYDEDKFQERKKAHEKGKDATGDYGDGKAKMNSRW